MGRCKFYSRAHGYGFITIEDERSQEVADFFFHLSAVIGDPPERHDAVKFWLDRDARRGNLVATQVQVLR
jgi:cold shock CspA family protein